MRAGSWLLRAVAALLAIVAGSSSAIAQNHDGDVLIKFGAFGQGTYLNFGVTQPAVGSASAGGGTGGVSVGIDYHPSRYYLFGIELDGVLGDARGDFNGTSYGLDYLVQLRGRFGVYASHDWMLYGTAGMGLLGFEAQRATSGSKFYQTATGLTVGFGAEYNLHHFVLFGEYSYATFGSSEFNINNIRHETDADAHMLRFGVKLKVGHDHLGRHHYD